MIKLNFQNLPQIGYRDVFITPSIPAIMIIKNNIEIVFENHFEKNYSAELDIELKERFLSHPIARLGGDCLAFQHIMIDLSEFNEFSYIVENLRYFKPALGWIDMVVGGLFKAHEREPDPDWL